MWLQHIRPRADSVRRGTETTSEFQSPGRGRLVNSAELLAPLRKLGEVGKHGFESRWGHHRQASLKRLATDKALDTQRATEAIAALTPSTHGLQLDLAS